MIKIRTFVNLFILTTFSIISLNAQDVPKDWHLLDAKDDGFPGISLGKAYDYLKKEGKKPTRVIVAVLDSGLDIEHEDLATVLWANTDEVANNEKDDDGNGYVDDLHGWNFIGNKEGESLDAATLGVTRLYKKYLKQFEGKNKFDIDETQKEEYLEFLIHKETFEREQKELKERIENNGKEYDFFNQLIPPLQAAVGKRIFSARELRSKKLKGADLNNKRENFFRIIERNKEKKLTSEKLIKHYEDIAERMNELNTRLKFNYSLDFDGRDLIKDDFTNMKEIGYGNADVTVRSEHGTHVSGIIGAKRGNKLGIDGIADNVSIMPVRTTPMGDEYDKDVANGIRYAVDNGARVINMSFGKSYSPFKEVVDAAVKYAEKKGVLMVHGSGNSSKNTDYYYNFPSPLMQDGTVVSNWLEIGAISPDMNEEMPANFSNYGKASVDIFAPGVDIYATLPQSKYDTRSGTSMASPVVAGVAAMLFSYFPELTAIEVAAIIMESGETYQQYVLQPGTKKRVPFSSLSKTGKVVNAFNAVKLANEKYTQ